MENQNIIDQQIMVKGDTIDRSPDNIRRRPATALTIASPEYCLRHIHNDDDIAGKSLGNDKIASIMKKRKVTRQLFLGPNTQQHMGRNSVNFNSSTPHRQRDVSYATSETQFHDNRHAIPDITDDDYEVEGYASESDKTSLYSSPENDADGFTGEAYIFNSASNKMVIHLGHKFHDVYQFRRAIEVFAIREGFKVCIMDNKSDFVSCECSALCCDWKITTSIQSNGPGFSVIDLVNQHTCNRSKPNFQPSSKWIAAMFLHCWKRRPDISPVVIQERIAAKYSVSCPLYKVVEASKITKTLLDIDHVDGYSDLYQYIDEMKKLHTGNVVILETDEREVVGHATFKRIFVCFAEPAYAFKYECRRLLFVDGWQLRGPFPSVMLVAVAIDGNNGILPIAFCEVVNEDIDSWVFFLTNLINVLKMEHGEGLCILNDGENGLDYVLEEYLCRAIVRQCCRHIFNQMVKKFPDAPVQHFFWAACRSACSYRFKKYMKLIAIESEECHAWLMGTNWNQWALHCMPDWVKSNNVTLLIIERLRRFMKQYLDMSITHRFTGLTQATASLFERRRVQGWEWVRQRLTPTVTKIIQQYLIEARWLTIQDIDETIMGVKDSSSTIYEVDLQRELCSCGLWQKSGVPCPHACKCILSKAENIDHFVHRMRTVSQYRDTYGPGMNTLPKELPWMSHAPGILLHPPPVDTKTVQHMLYPLPPTIQVNFPRFYHLHFLQYALIIY